MTAVIEVVRYGSAADLLAAAREFLLANEAMNNHIFGVLGDAAGGRYADGNNLWLGAVDGGTLVGCAFRTSPWPLSIAFGSSPEVAGELAAAAAGTYRDAFEISISPRFKVAVEAAVGQELVADVGQGIYRLRSVRFPTDVAGQLRRAVERDIDLMTKWTLAFQDEVRDGIRLPESQLRGLVQQWIRAGVISIWTVQGEPASMASARGPTPNGIRISLVYTPPEHRQNGYASAAVAALSQQQLDSGRQFCFLFTDLGNPTSNHIYQTIGYEKVGELTRYRRR